MPAEDNEHRFEETRVTSSDKKEGKRDYGGCRNPLIYLAAGLGFQPAGAFGL
jgi:hypothetical protein